MDMGSSGRGKEWQRKSSGTRRVTVQKGLVLMSSVHAAAGRQQFSAFPTSVWKCWEADIKECFTAYSEPQTRHHQSLVRKMLSLQTQQVMVRSRPPLPFVVRDSYLSSPMYLAAGLEEMASSCARGDSG